MDAPQNPRRQQQITVIRRAIQEVISRGFSDPRIRGMISVTGLELSDDRRDAVVSVSVLPAERAALTMMGLEHALGHIQTQVAAQVAMRKLPRLRFRLDETLKKEAEVFAAIRAGRARDAELERERERSESDRKDSTS